MSDKKLDLILEKLVSMEQATNDRFDKIDQRFDKIEQRLDKIESDLTSTKEMVANTAENVSALKNSQDRQDRILDALSSRSLEQETQIKELKRIK